MIIFVKYPVKGMVKNRLSNTIGADQAATIYRMFVMDLLARLSNLNVPLVIGFHPDDAGERFRQWLGDQYDYVPQRGRDLGERMRNSFEQAFKNGFKRVILIGSDIPDVPIDFINHAFHSLSTSDAAIGPSFDGGYYLIGFRSNGFIPEIFDGMIWGTETVLKDTLDILRDKGSRVHMLPSWRDIDTLPDLKDLIMRNQDTAFRHSQTMDYLLSHDPFIEKKG